MKKIVTVCGQGLGSSLIVEINSKQILNELGIGSKYEVSHESLNSYVSGTYDYVICGEDIAESIDSGTGKKIILSNLTDVEELKTKLIAAIKE